MFVSRSHADTARLARRLAGKGKQHIFGLVGELGSGKTTFVQAFLRALGVRGRILSPTFIIIKPYTLHLKPSAIAYHIDCYRIKKPGEFLKLGLKKILADKENIVLIEWAEKIKRYLPPKTVWLEFKHGRKEKERIITPLTD